MPRGYTLRDAALGHHLSAFAARNVAKNFEGSDQLAAEQLLEAIPRTADVFAEALTVIGYGLDFRAYMRFRSMMPVVHFFLAGNTSVDWMREPPSDPQEVRSGIEFVVDTAVRLQDDVGS